MSRSAREGNLVTVCVGAIITCHLQDSTHSWNFLPDTCSRVLLPGSAKSFAILANTKF